MIHPKYQILSIINLYFLPRNILLSNGWKKFAPRGIHLYLRALEAVDEAVAWRVGRREIEWYNW